jgi:hypothetical protein
MAGFFFVLLIAWKVRDSDDGNHVCVCACRNNKLFSKGINHGGYFLGKGSNMSYVDKASV